MPTYQYRCTDCSEPLEVVQSFTDDALSVCPACNGRLRKVFSSVGVVFKGSGFYRTDSRAETGGSKAESKSETKAESTTDAKPGAKSGAGTESSGSKAETTGGSESKPATKSTKADSSTPKSSAA
ncbi:MAG: FmdB family zinc ribbon protein [Actinomycetes bacterium]